MFMKILSRHFVGFMVVESQFLRREKVVVIVVVVVVVFLFFTFYFYLLLLLLLQIGVQHDIIHTIYQLPVTIEVGYFSFGM